MYWSEKWTPAWFKPLSDRVGTINLENDCRTHSRLLGAYHGV